MSQLKAVCGESDDWITPKSSASSNGMGTMRRDVASDAGASTNGRIIGLTPY